MPACAGMTEVGFPLFSHSGEGDCVLIENKMPFSTIGHVMMTGHKKHVPVPSSRRRPGTRIAPKCWIPACAGMTDRVDLAIFGIRYQFLLSPWFMLVGAEASNCKSGDRIDQLSSKSDSVSIFSATETLSDA